jgi:predicted alpha/beta hydrolase
MLVGICPEKVDALVLAACGSPWVEAYDGPVRTKIEKLIEAIPALAEEHGYYPGDLVGFGGDDAAGVMADWRHLAQTNRYRFTGDDASLGPRIAEYAGPVLAIRMADDDFAPERSVQACVDRFVASRPEQRVLDTDQIGATADHFGWAKEPAAVTATIAEWVLTR